MTEERTKEDDEFDEWFNNLSEEDQRIFNDIEGEIVDDLEDLKDY